MARKDELLQVYYDNLRNNQIGGETDGISKEVAEDLGYSATPESLQADIQTTQSPASTVDVQPYVIAERRPWRDNLTTEEQKIVGRSALKALRNQYPHLN